MDLLGPMWIVVALIIALGMMMVLYTIASHYLRAIYLHDLTREAHELRNQYARRLEAMRRGLTSSVEIVSPGMDEVMVGVDILDEDEEAAVLASAGTAG